MICSECSEEGERSKVEQLYGTKTALGFNPFYDEDGVYHRHDPNKSLWLYRCNRGHEFHRSESAPCPAPDCNYGEVQHE